MLRLAARRVPIFTRSFTTTVAKQDLVQDLYLKEIKSFKPAPRGANDHEGQVLKWAAPKSPSAPKPVEADSAVLDEYSNTQVEVDTSKGSAEGEEAPAQSMDEWFVVEDTFAEEAKH